MMGFATLYPSYVDCLKTSLRLGADNSRLPQFPAQVKIAGNCSGSIQITIAVPDSVCYIPYFFVRSIGHDHNYPHQQRSVNFA